MITSQEFESTEVRIESAGVSYTNPDNLVGEVWRSIHKGSVVADTVVASMRTIGSDLSNRHLDILARCGARGARRQGNVVSQEYGRIRREALRMQRNRGLIP